MIYVSSAFDVFLQSFTYFVYAVIGLERGEVNCENEFNIYTREAGSGGLAISVEGPSKAEIKFTDKNDGSCVVAYTCTDPGK